MTSDRFRFTRRVIWGTGIFAASCVCVVAWRNPDALGQVISTLSTAWITASLGLAANANWAETRERKS
ncbi:MAG: hypothetical protein AAF607_15855 [Pseudomonadota bacterium]